MRDEDAASGFGETIDTSEVKLSERERVILSEPVGARKRLRGSHEVAEERGDGTLLLRRESCDEVIERYADRPLSEADFDEALQGVAGAFDGARASAPTRSEGVPRWS